MEHVPLTKSRTWRKMVDFVQFLVSGLMAHSDGGSIQVVIASWTHPPSQALKRRSVHHSLLLSSGLASRTLPSRNMPESMVQRLPTDVARRVRRRVPCPPLHERVLAQRCAAYRPSTLRLDASTRLLHHRAGIVPDSPPALSHSRGGRRSSAASTPCARAVRHGVPALPAMRRARRAPRGEAEDAVAAVSDVRAGRHRIPVSTATRRSAGGHRVPRTRGDAASEAARRSGRAALGGTGAKPARRGARSRGETSCPVLAAMRRGSEANTGHWCTSGGGARTRSAPPALRREAARAGRRARSRCCAPSRAASFPSRAAPAARLLACGARGYRHGGAVR
ncbi:hypothetical protein DFH09DRAFT_1396983 [Mycena vulgaris]|nr:hypothetical protein DFH09DRAFT_1396983 [Mycena vulgaris]